jgi:hypothetical protein
MNAGETKMYSCTAHRCLSNFEITYEPSYGEGDGVRPRDVKFCPFCGKQEVAAEEGDE